MTPTSEIIAEIFFTLQNMEIGIKQLRSNLNNPKMKRPIIPMCNPEIAKTCAVPDFTKFSRKSFRIEVFVPVVIAFAIEASSDVKYFSVFLLIS